MIDFDNAETIPDSIKTLIKRNQKFIENELIFENRKALEGHKWSGGIITKNCFVDTAVYIRELLSYEQLIGFHCTKLIEPRNIYESGLKKLCMTEYEQRVMQFLREKLQDNKLISEISYSFSKLASNGGYDNRKNMIYFLINKSLIYDYGTIDFFKYFGGEIIRQITYNMKEIVYPILRRNGVPSVVSFEFSFTELPNCRQDNLIGALIKSQVLGMKMDVEGFIERNIEPKEIIKVYSNRNITKLQNSVASELV